METDELIELEIPAAHKWLLDTVKMLVDHESCISIVDSKRGIVPGFLHRSPSGTTEPSVREVTFSLMLHHEDVGRVIGRNGKTARALRMLLAARAKKGGYAVVLDIENPQRPGLPPAHTVHVVEQSHRRA